MAIVLIRGLSVATGTLGLFFLLLALRSRFHRELWVRGAWVVLGATFSTIDSFVIRGTPNLTAPALVFWIRAQHLLILPIGLLIIKDLLSVTGIRDRSLKLFVTLSIALIPFVLSANLRAVETRVVGEGFAYWLSSAFILLLGLYPLSLLVRGLRSETPEHKHELRSYLFGYLAIFVGGSHDLLTVLNVFPYVHLPWLTFGWAIFTAFGCYSLYDRTLELHRLLVHTLDELKTAYSELELARQLSSVGEQASKISHDMKNFVGTLMLSARELEKSELSKLQKLHVDTILNQGQRLNDLAREILDATQEPVRRIHSPVNLSQLLDEIVKRPDLPETARVTLHGDTSDAWIYGDRLKLERVFLNLLSNAIDAKKSDAPLATIDITLEKQDSDLVIDFTDHGKGLSETDLSRIFVPFYSTKGSSGTGLGLAIVKNVIEAHGGTIEVKNLADHIPGETGARFILRLPRAPKLQPPSPTARNSS